VAKNAKHAALFAQRVAFEIVATKIVPELMLDRTVMEGMVSVLV
jgi:hypothetical protein